MPERAQFTKTDARRIGEQIGIDWNSAPFDVDQLRRGMEVELEHGLHPAVRGSRSLVSNQAAKSAQQVVTHALLAGLPGDGRDNGSCVRQRVVSLAEGWLARSLWTRDQGNDRSEMFMLAVGPGG